MVKSISTPLTHFLKENRWSSASSSETNFCANLQSLTNSSGATMAGLGERAWNLRLRVGASQRDTRSRNGAHQEKRIFGGGWCTVWFLLFRRPTARLPTCYGARLDRVWVAG